MCVCTWRETVGCFQQQPDECYVCKLNTEHMARMRRPAQSQHERRKKTVSFVIPQICIISVKAEGVGGWRRSEDCRLFQRAITLKPQLSEKCPKRPTQCSSDWLDFITPLDLW